MALHLITHPVDLMMKGGVKVTPNDYTVRKVIFNIASRRPYYTEVRGHPFGLFHIILKEQKVF